MGIKTGNSIKDAKISQITDYYFFQKKIDYVINGIDNPLIKQPKKNKTFMSKILNPYNEDTEQYFYVIDKKWIDDWKKYSNYELAKTYFDKINIVDNNQITKEVNEACLNMALTEEINDSKDNFPGKMDNKLEGESFCKNVFTDLKNLDFLVSENLFMNFETLIGQYWKFKKESNTLRIKGMIKNRIIILVFRKELQIKFIFNNQGLYELTADFCLEDDASDEKKKKYKSNIDNLLKNEIRRFQFDDWLDFFNKNGIDEKNEIPIVNKNGENIYILKKNEDINNTRGQQSNSTNNNSSNINNSNQINNINNAMQGNNMNLMNNFNFNNNLNGFNNMNEMINNNQINFQQNQVNNFNMNNMNQMNNSNMNNMNQMNNFNMNNMNQMNNFNMNNFNIMNNNFNMYNMNQMNNNFNMNNVNQMNNNFNMNNINQMNNMNQMNNFNNMNNTNNMNQMNNNFNMNNMNQMNNNFNMNNMNQMNNN